MTPPDRINDAIGAFARLLTRQVIERSSDDITDVASELVGGGDRDDARLIIAALAFASDSGAFKTQDEQRASYGLIEAIETLHIEPSANLIAQLDNWLERVINDEDERASLRQSMLDTIGDDLALPGDRSWNEIRAMAEAR